MDKTSAAYENFSKKMEAMSGGPKIGRSTMKIGGGTGLVGRVTNNEKKISILKNIFKAQKQEIGEKITPKVNNLELSFYIKSMKEVFKDIEKEFEPNNNVTTKAIIGSFNSELKKIFKEENFYNKTSCIIGFDVAHETIEVRIVISLNHIILERKASHFPLY